MYIHHPHHRHHQHHSQIEHHLFPSVSSDKLHILMPIVKQTCKEFNVRNGSPNGCHFEYLNLNFSFEFGMSMMYGGKMIHILTYLPTSLPTYYLQVDYKTYDTFGSIVNSVHR